jgi:hypothetical protein
LHVTAGPVFASTLTEIESIHSMATKPRFQVRKRENYANRKQK